MSKEEAIDFLAQHQPMPSDSVLATNLDIIDKYDTVRKYFEQYPDEACIPLFLNSFGERDGLGVYQLVQNTLLKFSSDVVLPYLNNALKSPYESVIYWATQIAAIFPDKFLLQSLIVLTSHRNADIRYNAISALSFIDTISTKQLLQQALVVENDENVKDLINEILQEN